MCRLNEVNTSPHRGFSQIRALKSKFKVHHPDSDEVYSKRMDFQTSTSILLVMFYDGIFTISRICLNSVYCIRLRLMHFVIQPASSNCAIKLSYDVILKFKL